MIKTCAHPSSRRTGMCDEDVADFLAHLFWRGDHALLKPLLDVQPYSDGALAETLGDFYANVLNRHTRLFLLELARRPKSEQHALALAAGLTDGSGMPPEMLRDVRHGLRRIAAKRSDRLAPVARRCLAAIEEAAEQTRNQR